MVHSSLTQCDRPISTLISKLQSCRLLIFASSNLQQSFLCTSQYGSVGKESTCNAGDPGLIPGSGRSAREGKGYLLQYSWAFLVAQLVKNMPAVQETWFWSLGWEDPLEKGKATHFSILTWRIPWTTVHGVAKSRTWLSNFDFHFQHNLQTVL